MAKWNGRTRRILASGDFSLLSGIGSHISSDGETRALLMVWSVLDMDRLAALAANSAEGYVRPDFPDLPDDRAAFVLTGSQPDDELLTAIQSLHDILNTDHERLRTAFQGREEAARQRAEFLKANPPQPKDIILNHWRIAPAAKGGGQ